MSTPLAHSGGHLLAAHLQCVAGMAADFSEAFEPAAATRAGPIWPACGMTWASTGRGFSATSRSPTTRMPTLRARWAGAKRRTLQPARCGPCKQFGETHGPNGALAARVLAYLIAGHHAGLDDWDGGLKERLADADCQTELHEALAENPPENILSRAILCPT